MDPSSSRSLRDGGARNCDRCCSRPADDDKVFDVDATEDVNQDLESRLPADSLLPMGDEANERENICNNYSSKQLGL